MEKYAYEFRGLKILPLDKTKIAQTLKKFSEIKNKIPMKDLRKVAKRIKIALEEYNMKIPFEIRQLTTNKRNPMYGVYLTKRATLIKGLKDMKIGLDKLAEINKLANENKLDLALNKLIKFDKHFGLDSMYNAGLPNPYETLFFPLPKPRNILEENLKKIASDEKMIKKMADYFPDSFIKEFKRNPIRTYKMSSLKYRELLDKIMEGKL
ncbi:MAG: hypothetical protein QXI58_00485 [Candidatus Micrarchaeia archaeon]